MIMIEIIMRTMTQTLGLNMVITGSQSRKVRKGIDNRFKEMIITENSGMKNKYSEIY